MNRYSLEDVRLALKVVFALGFALGGLACAVMVLVLKLG